MVRENRIKETRFSLTFSGTVTGSFASDSPVNGEILEVEWNYPINSGSLSLSTEGSGTLAGQEFWRRNAPSGAANQYASPVHLTQSTTGSDAIGTSVPFISNGRLFLNTGSALSGTSPLVLFVRYR